MGLLFPCLYKSQCQAIGSPPGSKHASLLTNIVLAHVTCFVPWHTRNMRYTLSEQKLVEHGVLFACFLILFSTQLERNISYRTCSFSLGLRVLEGKENGIEPVLCRIAPPGPLFPDVLPIMMFWYKARVLLRMQFMFLIS